ncbi:MAG: hypothetical protein QW738_09600 [Nitrososphaeria archaeon]
MFNKINQVEKLLISFCILSSFQFIADAIYVDLMVYAPQYLVVDGADELSIFVDYNYAERGPFCGSLPFEGSLIIKSHKGLVTVNPSNYELRSNIKGTFKYSVTLIGVKPGTETIVVEIYRQYGNKLEICNSRTITIPVVLADNYVDLYVQAPKKVEKNNVETVKIYLKNKMLNKSFSGFVRALGAQSIISPETATVSLNPMETKQIFFSFLIPENATDCEENIKISLYSGAGEVLDIKDIKFNFCELPTSSTPGPILSIPGFEISWAIFGLIAIIIFSILRNKKK